MEYRLIRSDRKTLYLTITQQGEVVVRAPRRCPQTYIDRFLASKESWIMEKRSEILREKDCRAQFRPAHMGTMAFCGIELRVRPAPENVVSLDLNHREISIPDLSVPEVRPAVAKLYKQAGMPYLKNRLDYWAKVMGISYGKLKFNSALRRWGSCSAEGNINITWYLLFAPERAIDYVLIHELAHRREFNHSKRFWEIVGAYMPDYPEQKKALVTLQKQLIRQGWSVKSEE